MVIHGFTIVEVMLYLAITSFLLVGLITNAGPSIANRRYSDSVTNFAEFIRSVYSDVADNQVSNGPSTGRGSQTIYGRLIEIGDPSATPSSNYAHVYTIIGNATTSATFTGKTALESLRAADAKPNLISPRSYSLPWDAKVEIPSGADARALILITQISGNIRTFTISGNSTHSFPNIHIDPENTFQTLLSNESEGDYSRFEEGHDLTFCIDSDDNRYNNRREVRLHAYASSSAAVELFAFDDNGNFCFGKGVDE